MCINIKLYHTLISGNQVYLSAIEIKNLKKTYSAGSKKSVEALKGIDLTIEEGEIFGYLGPNGAGKTTTLKILLGFISPSEGSVKLMGYPHEEARFHIRIGYVPEDHSYYPHLKVKKFLNYMSELSSDDGNLMQRVEKVVEEFKLQKAYEKRMGDLSLGWRQKVALAAAFIDEPQLLILDEPTSGLDPESVEDFIATMKSGKSKDQTILFCSHQLSNVEKIADRIGIISKGEIVKTGSVQELLISSGSSTLNELFLETMENSS